MLLLLTAAGTAAAQTNRAELVLPPWAASPELVGALRRAVQPLPASLVTADEPACPERTSTEATLRIALQASSDGAYRLCFVWGEQRETRELGPFTALDATAREQISTIVEATVEAMRPVDPDAVSLEDAAPLRFLLSAGYAPSLLRSSHYAHGVAAELGLELPLALFVSVHLGYTFPTTLARSGTAATADALAARAALGGAIPLASSLTLLGLLGVTVERLSVRGNGVQVANARTPVDPWLTLQVGPRLVLHPSFWLNARVGADFGFTRREFGFERGSEFVEVFASGPVRFNFELHAGCFL
ncbi:MAG TPA: hypothetical protein VJR89_01925 [Polyangiales bacterium]|nr:hypothetical protein [Polyangiales bacterium]